MENETRPTPETDYEERIDNGDTKPLFVFCRKLERERDELREAIAEFCKHHDWACDSWRKQPHIARLFKLNKKHD
jgi:hypothetical protein